MELKLSNCSIEKFVNYAIERMNRHRMDNKYHYSYMTESRLRKVFQYMCDRKTKCSGSNYYISDTDGFISKFSQPEEEKQELMEEMLFHEVWCKCEWIYRIIDKEREFYESLKGYVGARKVKEFENVM